MASYCLIRFVNKKRMGYVLAAMLLGSLSIPGVGQDALVVLPPTATADEILQGFIGKTTRSMQSNSCPSGKTVAINIPFDYDSATLTTEAMATLSEVAKAMENSALTKCVFYVEGHTDAKGAHWYNLGLSRRRAGAVEEHLNSIGVKMERLVSIGMGSKQPINTADPFAAENRRVEFRTR